MFEPYRSMQMQEHAFAHACLHMVSLTVLDSLHDRKSGFVGDPTNAAQPGQTSQNELHSLKENYSVAAAIIENYSVDVAIIKNYSVAADDADANDDDDDDDAHADDADDDGQ